MQFRNFVENQLDCKIKAFQSVGSLEFDNSPLKRHFQDCGILFHMSCLGTPEQNGVAERKHRYLIEMSRTFLVAADMPGEFWVDAVFIALHMINRLSTPMLNGQTPDYRLYNKQHEFLKV